MAVRNTSESKKYVHILYSPHFENDPEYVAHLPDLKVPFQELGYTVEEVFVTAETVRQQTSHIPVDDKDHVIFLHVDMPPQMPLGTKMLEVRYVEKAFRWVIGSSSEYSENCVWKSVMNKLFDANQVPRVPSIRVQVSHSKER
jgi:hypothetical protein